MHGRFHYSPHDSPCCMLLELTHSRKEGVHSCVYSPYYSHLNCLQSVQNWLKMLWSKVEEIMGEIIPICIKTILSSCGYNTFSSLKNISLQRIENHVNEHCHSVVHDFDCCYHEYYKSQKVFKFLPGHCDLLVTVSKSMNQHTQADSGESLESANLARIIEKTSGFSVILKELILTAIHNEKLNKNNAEYSDIIRHFATYIYIIGGRSCYEVLYQNLPLPSRSTICE